jgi:hypothetical protein
VVVVLVGLALRRASRDAERPAGREVVLVVAF